MKKSALLFCSLLLSCELFADYDTVKFSGNKIFFDASLRAVLGIENGGLKFWKQQKLQIDEPQLEEMGEKLLDFYNSKGYYKAKIDKNISGSTVTFNISEGEGIRVESLQLQSATDLSRFIKLRLKDTFTTESFSATKEAIRRHLDETGYPKAQLNSHAKIDLDSYKAELSFAVDEREQSNFGPIKIEKIEGVSQKAIRQKLSFKEGDRYDIRKIEDSYQNLYMSDLFSSLSVHPDIDAAGLDVPIEINATLGPLRSFKIGLGYNTDEGVRAKFSWLHRNFFEDFRRLEASAQFSAIRQNAGVKLSFPDVYGLGVENLSLFEMAKFDGYTEEQLSNTVKFGYTLGITQHYLGFRVESGKVTAETQSEYIKNKSYFADAFIYEYILDRRDSKIDAKKGHLIAWNMELTDQYLGSSLNYAKTNLEARKIISFDGASSLANFLFAVRANIGIIDDYKKNDIPIFKRFFAGGSFSNRGYAYRRLGRQDEHGNFVGGNSLVDLSFEARARITKEVWGVLFYDDTVLNIPSFAFGGEHKRSIGIGGRYQTLVGPIRLDIGLPLNEEGKRARVNISFGQVF